MVKVSIIIPTYNKEKYIEKCVNSLMHQSYKDYSEIIVVDDGSKDNTLKILEKYNNIKILTQEHKGPGEARNFGAKEAKGDILILIDADMEFSRNYVENLVKPIQEEKCIGTSHIYEFVINKDNIWSKCFGTKRAWFGRTEKSKMDKNIRIFRAMKKEEFLKMGGFDSKAGYWDDGTLNKQGIAVTDAICYHYNPSSLKEVYEKSKWIGGSFIVNYPRIFERIKKFAYLIFPMLIISLILLYYLKGYSLLIIPLFILILTIRRTITERYFPFLFFLPIFYIVKLFGLIVGALNQIPNIISCILQGKEIAYKY